MEQIKNMLVKLIINEKISDSDINRLVLGKNSHAIEKITKHLSQTADIAKAIKNNPKILEEVFKNKAITEIFKYTKKNKRRI